VPRSTTRPTRPPTAPIDGDLSLSLAQALPSYRRHLAAENKSPATIALYGLSVERFERYLRAQGMPSHLAGIRREHIEAWLWRPGTSSMVILEILPSRPFAALGVTPGGSFALRDLLLVGSCRSVQWCGARLMGPLWTTTTELSTVSGPSQPLRPFCAPQVLDRWRGLWRSVEGV
jgi:hypothetical protein